MSNMKFALPPLPAYSTVSIQAPRDVHSMKTLTELPRPQDLKRSDFLYSDMLPEPDYSDGEDGSGVRTDEDGLILPRKLGNPCLDSVERQSVHRELLFNQRMGRSVIGQKSELQRAMERHQEQQTRREAETRRNNNRSSFERLMQERAEKLEKMDEPEEPKTISDNNEFMKIHAKVRSKMEPH